MPSEYEGTRSTAATSSCRPERKARSTFYACSCHRKELLDGLSTRSVTTEGDYHDQFSLYYRTLARYLHHHSHLMASAPLALPSTFARVGHSRDEKTFRIR